jgi:stalled ribosome rescue protein Dom34
MRLWSSQHKEYYSLKIEAKRVDFQPIRHEDQADSRVSKLHTECTLCRYQSLKLDLSHTFKGLFIIIESIISINMERF